MNKLYWESYYQKQNIDQKPSLFAKFIKENFCKNARSLIELGCGNGRDAIFFANNHFDVLAVDQCEKQIDILKEKYCNLKNILFLTDDFTNLKDMGGGDIIYSRFTLHAVTKEEESRTLQWAYRNLKKNGIFCVEARGMMNEIYGKGKPVNGQTNAYIYDEHYRRFIVFEELCEELSKLGFHNEYAHEAKGFAPYHGEDQIFIRIIARKLND